MKDAIEVMKKEMLSKRITAYIAFENYLASLNDPDWDPDETEQKRSDSATQDALLIQDLLLKCGMDKDELAAWEDEKMETFTVAYKHGKISNLARFIEEL